MPLISRVSETQQEIKVVCEADSNVTAIHHNQEDVKGGWPNLYQQRVPTLTLYLGKINKLQWKMSHS